MITILMPITKKNIDLEKIFSAIENCKYKEQITLNLACRTNPEIMKKCTEIKKSFQVIVNMFPINATENGMIDTCFRNEDFESVILVRENSLDLSSEIFNMLIENGTKNNIVMFKRLRKENKLKKFLSTSAKKLCKKFFGFTFFEGDISIQYFGQNVVEILREVNAFLPTKINKWIGIEIKYIDTPKVVSLENKLPKKIILPTIINILVIIGTIIFAIFLPKLTTITVLIFMLMTLLILSELTILAYNLLKIYCHKKIGSITKQKTNIFQRREL